MERFIKKRYRWIIALALLFMASVSIYNAWDESAIFDETAHIGAAYSYLEKHDMRLNPEHPPLIKDLAALPLTLIDLNFDTKEDFWTKDVNGQWDAGKSLLYHSGNDADQILFLSRLPIVLLSLILGFFIFKWTKELAGTVGGVLALALYAFDPNILGHNHFVTTDLGIAAFITFSFYYFLRFVKEPTWKNVLVGGLFLGLAQLAKFSAVMIFPVFALAVIIYPLVIKKKDQRFSQLRFRLMKLGEYLGKSALAFLVSMIVVWGVYAVNIYKMPEAKLSETIDFYFSPELNDDGSNQREVITNKSLIALSKSELTKPLSEYLLGVAMVFKRVSGGNSVYYMGEVSSTAFASYFPVVFSLKEPLPNLLLFSIALLGSLVIFLSSTGKALRVSGRKALSEAQKYLRHNISTFSMFLFIALYSYVSITGNLNLGIRHLFPILPFAFILTAKMILELIRKSHSRHLDAILKTGLAISLAFLILETVLSFPFYMSYFNEAGKGPHGGYVFVTDSNADWGQDLKRLKRFLDEHPEIQDIRLDYFGGGDPNYYLEGRFTPWWDSKRPIEAGWYAVSVNFLEGSIHDRTKSPEESYSWLRDKKPAYQVGTSILVYDIKPEDLK